MWSRVRRARMPGGCEKPEMALRYNWFHARGLPRAPGPHARHERGLDGAVVQPGEALGGKTKSCVSTALSVVGGAGIAVPQLRHVTHCGSQP